MSSLQNNIEETIDVGFFMNPIDPSKTHPGRLSREAEGQLRAIMLETHNDQFIRDVQGAGRGETWLFSGEKGNYVLHGLRGRSFGSTTQRGNLLGGYETFLRYCFGVEAVFRVREQFLLGEKNPFPAISGDITFDAFSLASSRIALWIGLQDVWDVSWPPQRPGRVEHPRLMSAIGGLSTYTEGKTDAYGISSRIWDVLEITFQEPMPMDLMYRHACTVHDFVNLTIGKFLPMSFTAFSPRDSSEGTGHVRQFELISQGRRFRPEEGDLDSILTPMLSLNDVGGLKGLSALIEWCQRAEINSTILRRVASRRSEHDAFTEHWRTLNMIHGGRQSERSRISKLVDDVGKSLVRSILPTDVDFKCWMDAIVQYRNEVVSHPSGQDTLDARMMHQGPVFTQQMEFLLKAYVLTRGVGVRLESPEPREALLYNVEGGWNQWDWRLTGESYTLY